MAGVDVDSILSKLAEAEGLLRPMTRIDPTFERLYALVREIEDQVIIGIAPTRCGSPECSEKLTYSGKGRRPAYCSVHCRSRAEYLRKLDGKGPKGGQRGTAGFLNSPQLEKPIRRLTWLNGDSGEVVFNSNPT
ncbi:hypothetical protein [Streptomyces sp. NPDC046805]|uniref:hypothetical protein n=1 Tax=Streptomyces sp. NPDC046805 TaxID=3155134 RepID=UPI0033CAC23C